LRSSTGSEQEQKDPGDVSFVIQQQEFARVSFPVALQSPQICNFLMFHSDTRHPLKDGLNQDHTNTSTLLDELERIQGVVAYCYAGT
jgi:hypothetical protein